MRCEDEKMFYRPPLLEEPCAQTLSGKTTKMQMVSNGQVHFFPLFFPLFDVPFFPHLFCFPFFSVLMFCFLIFHVFSFFFAFFSSLKNIRISYRGGHKFNGDSPIMLGRCGECHQQNWGFETAPPKVPLLLCCCSRQGHSSQAHWSRKTRFGTQRY